VSLIEPAIAIEGTVPDLPAKWNGAVESGLSPNLPELIFY